jgi:hypothetical protein
MTTFTNQQYGHHWTQIANLNSGVYNTQIFSSEAQYKSAINQMFLYNGTSGIQRIQTYSLSLEELKSLLNIGSGLTPNNQIRIHLAGNPNIGYNHIEDNPSFLFILDAYHLKQGEKLGLNMHHILDTAKKTSPLKGSINEGDLPPSSPKSNGISKQEAWSMINEYQTKFPPSTSQGTANNFAAAILSENATHPDRLVRGYIVGSLDTNNLVAHVNGIQEDEGLFIHCGYLTGTLPTNDWFRYRTILQINNTNSNGQKEAFYYEFTRPCPPACGDGYTVQPLSH